MHDFGISLRLGMMISRVSRVKKKYMERFWKYGTKFRKFWVKVENLVMER